METPVVPQNIVLIGFMGSGKSSIGRLIAPRVNFQFIDTDQWVIQKTGLQITEIFKTHGETFFRDQETLALESLLGRKNLVISTGGGIVLREKNTALLRELGFVTWLTASEETIYDRVSRNNKRPLVQTANPRETIHNLLTERSPLYTTAAHSTIDTGAMTHDQVADAIILEAQRAI